MGQELEKRTENFVAIDDNNIYVYHAIRNFLFLLAILHGLGASADWQTTLRENNPK